MITLMFLNVIMKKDAQGKVTEKREKRLRHSFFCVAEINKKGMARRPFGESIKPLVQNDRFPYGFIGNKVCFWDEESSRFYVLTVRPCAITEKDGVKMVFLPETVPNLYKVSYKFNTISNAETIYMQNNDSDRLHAGFLNWDILILDDKPMNYLNIDRDRLKEGAIDEEELLAVRKKILLYWCGYFCSGRVEKNIDNENGAYAGGLSKFPETLLSLILLFYQNVPSEDFEKFMEPYHKTVESWGLVLGEEKIPISYLWDRAKVFQASQPLHMDIQAKATETSTEGIVEISPKTVRHLPHRLINVESIFLKQDSELLYQFHLHMPDEAPNVIYLDEGARFYDYMSVFESHKNEPEQIDYSKVQKKVLKPNKMYETLVVSCYLRTFQRGRNFSSVLERCICWYILSPFDKDAASLLKKGICNGDNVQVKCYNKVVTRVANKI